MPPVTIPREDVDRAVPFNSLFEMQTLAVVTYRCGTGVCAFNSLFEMRIYLDWGSYYSAVVFQFSI